MELLKAIEFIKELTIKRAVVPWLHSDFLFKITRDGQTYYQMFDMANKIFDEYLKNKIKCLEEEQSIGKSSYCTIPELIKIFSVVRF